MLTTNKTRTLRAEFEKTKNAQFLSSRLWQEFGDKDRVFFNDFLKSKSKIFAKEHKYLMKHYEYRAVGGIHLNIVKKLTKEVEKLNEIAHQTNTNENVKAQIIAAKSNIDKLKNELLDFGVIIFDIYHN